MMTISHANTWGWLRSTQRYTVRQRQCAVVDYKNCLFPSSMNLYSLRHALVEHLDDHQALVKQFARILDFVLKFDECKMTTPAVQNDFSYYRRTVQVKFN